jgi:hypothetical protein
MSKDGFLPFPSIPRLHRQVTVTEKIDGSNGLICIQPDVEGPWENGEAVAYGGAEQYAVYVGSRSRWITPKDDNFGFARWVQEYADTIATDLGPGVHYGEWWGHGIQRGYGKPKGVRYFSLFNSARWTPHLENFQTPHLEVVPTLWIGNGDNLNHNVDITLQTLRALGSVAAPGFMKPEGIVIYHRALNGSFKVTLEKDDEPKGKH